MSQQYSGGPDDESGRPPAPGAAPNPFSREAAGDGAGLGSDGPAPNSVPEDDTEPDGIVGAPGGPSGYPSPDPYGGPGGYSANTGYPPEQTQPYPSSQPYPQDSTYPSQPSSPAPDAPYASPAGAAAPTDPYSAPSASEPAPSGYGASYGQSTGYPPNPYDTGGYQYSTVNPYGYSQQQHPKGTTALVLGILGIVLCPFVGVVGFTISSRARKEVQAEPMRYSNGGMITAGWVLGIVSIVYASFAAIYLVIVMIAVISEL
ncbi:hypothetical protein [Microlunatus sp. GCM10028923]|uniref:hypothetical protein n=1 Tax=Microlunatus sp. GCM10028923 TaxID=3273400 RepID=UPI0036097F35